MKYPSYNTDVIQGLLDEYRINFNTVPLLFDEAGISLNSLDYTTEKYIELYHKNNTFKPSRKQYVQILKIYRDSPFVTDYSKKIIDVLIGNRKLYNKVVFCHDGLSCNNGIWGYVDKYDYSYNIDIYSYDPNIHSTNCYNSYINISKELLWIYNHYDIIFIQLLPNLDIEMEIKYTKLDNEKCCDFRYQLGK